MHQTKKFFDPTIFQKCWRGSGRVALIAARRQRNPRAIPLAHGEGGEKSNRFSRRGEQDRPALFPDSNHQSSCNCASGTGAMDVLLFHMKQCSWKTNCVRFGRIASLSAFVLFAGGCVVRIGYESFLDFSFSEFFLFLEWRTAVHFVSLRFQYHLINTSVREGSLPSLTTLLRRAEPARPLLPAARIFEPLCKFIRSFLLLLPANPLGLPVQFLRHPLPFLQSDCTLLFHRVLFG